jgi:hypothetical protein
MEETMAGLDEIRAAKAVHTEALMAMDNVVGVATAYKVSKGEQTDELAVVALVRDKLSPDSIPRSQLLPQTLDGVPTDVVQVGELRALQARTDRWRPAPGGVSIGHFAITAGTLGVVVRDRSSGDRLILSNNHVLANSNDASEGDAIIQPGGADGGRVNSDTIAHLERFIPIDFGEQTGGCDIAAAYVAAGNFMATLVGSSHRVSARQVNRQAVNMVDAALARQINDADVLDEILEIGTITGTVEGELGMPVRKSGRTTGFTTGEITGIDATVSVNYGGGRTATFENQLIAGPMSQGGDSGSLVVHGDSLDAVGLLFAGSSQTTIFSPIQAVLDSLQVEF